MNAALQRRDPPARPAPIRRSRPRRGAGGDAPGVPCPDPTYTLHEGRGVTTWMLSREPGPHGVTVAKMRITRPPPARGTELKVHPGQDWFTVLSGTIVLLLGERTIMVEAGQAAEFSTMIPHAFGAHGLPSVYTLTRPRGKAASWRKVEGATHLSVCTIFEPPTFVTKGSIRYSASMV